MPTRSTRSSGNEDPKVTPSPPSKRADKKRKTPSASPSEPKRKISKTQKPKSKPTKISGHFSNAEIITGKIVTKDIFTRFGAISFVEKLRAQGWENILMLDGILIYEREVREFFANASVEDGVVSSSVNGENIKFNQTQLGFLLGIPSYGFDRYDLSLRSFQDMKRLVELVDTIGKGKDFMKGYAISKKVMEPFEQLFYMLLIKTLLPRGEGREYVNFRDLQLIDYFMKGEPINLPSLIISHISHIVNDPKGKKIPYDVILSILFTFMDLKRGKGEKMEPRCHFEGKMMRGCDLKEEQKEQLPPKPSKGKEKIEEMGGTSGTKSEAVGEAGAHSVSQEVPKDNLQAQIDFLTKTVLDLLSRTPPPS